MTAATTVRCPHSHPLICCAVQSVLSWMYTELYCTVLYGLYCTVQSPLALELEVVPTQKAALALYRVNGFETVDRMRFTRSL